MMAEVFLSTPGQFCGLKFIPPSFPLLPFTPTKKSQLTPKQYCKYLKTSIVCVMGWTVSPQVYMVKSWPPVLPRVTVLNLGWSQMQLGKVWRQQGSPLSNRTTVLRKWWLVRRKEDATKPQQHIYKAANYQRQLGGLLLPAPGRNQPHTLNSVSGLQDGESVTFAVKATQPVGTNTIPGVNTPSKNGD